VGLCG